MGCSLVLALGLLGELLVLDGIFSLLLLKLLVKVLSLLHLLFLMVHHIEEVLGVDLAVASSSFTKKLLELLVLSLELPNELILRALVDDSLVLNLFGSICVTQRRQRLLEVHIRGRNSANHNCF